MASPKYQSLAVDPDLPSSMIELQSFDARNKYGCTQGDDNHATFPVPPDSRRLLVDKVSPGYAQRCNTLPSKLREAATRSYKWKYPRLSPYFVKFGRLRKIFRGWRVGVMTAAIVCAVVLLANIIFTVGMIAKYGTTDGVGIIYTGDCGLVKRWNTALHMLINVLATCLLTASSFTMQCLSSPTRSEADAAHAQGKELDIGIVSLKNLFHMNRLKGLLWWALALSTLPLHVFYNSTVFSPVTTNQFLYLIVNEDFFNGAPYDAFNHTACTMGSIGGLIDRNCSIPGKSDVEVRCDSVQIIDSIYDAWNAGHYSDKMTPSQCIDAYGEVYLSNRRNMIAVTKATPGMRMAPTCAFTPQKENLTYFDGYPQPLWNGSSVLAFDYSPDTKTFLCQGYDGYDYQRPYMGLHECDRQIAQSLLSKNGTWYLRPHDKPAPIDSVANQAYPVEYCISEVFGQDRCQLRFMSYPLLIVIGCNVVKVVCMLSATRLLWDLNEPILATIGDAATSYMEHPDESTKGWCIMDSAEVAAWRRAEPGDTQQGGQYNRPASRRLFAATSKLRWYSTMTICTAYLILGIGVLQPAAVQLGYNSSWTVGFGAVSESALLNASVFQDLLKSILIANFFQLALSTTYFLYNSLYTAQCAALEWSSYAGGGRKPLRVTSPRGEQRSEYYLQLPLCYGVSLTVFLMVLHFLVSQSIFLVQVQSFDLHGDPSETIGLSGVGFSTVAILATICVGGILILVQILHTFRPLNNRIPIHGNSSVVISAMCHTNSDTSPCDQGATVDRAEENPAFQKVMWGAVVEANDEHEIGHCSFSAHPVELPVQGRRYK